MLLELHRFSHKTCVHIEKGGAATSWSGLGNMNRTRCRDVVGTSVASCNGDVGVDTYLTQCPLHSPVRQSRGEDCLGYCLVVPCMG